MFEIATVYEPNKNFDINFHVHSATFNNADETTVVYYKSFTRQKMSELNELSSELR